MTTDEEYLQFLIETDSALALQYYFRGGELVYNDNNTTYHNDDLGIKWGITRNKPIKQIIDDIEEYLKRTAPIQAVKGVVPVETNTLTKREQFAMAAMQGLLAFKGNSRYIGSNAPSRHDIADIAVEQAEALLTRLRKTGL
jgi:hypothetical protein